MKSLRMSQIALSLMLAGWTCVAYAQNMTFPAIGDTANSALEERNKALVLRVYSSVLPNSDRAVAAQIVSADAVEYSGVEGKGVDGLLAVFNGLKMRIPNVKATIAHTVADGDYVVVHWHASATPGNRLSGENWMDTYKVQDGKIVGVWSASEVIKKSVSGHDPFSDLYKYPSGAPKLTEAQEEANRNQEMDFNRIPGNFTEAKIREYWADNQIEHNFTDPDGNQHMIDQFANQTTARAGRAGGTAAAGGPAGGARPGGAPAGPPPGGGFNFVGYFADGDLVFEINRVAGTKVLADLYRVVNGKVVEKYRVTPTGFSFGPPPAQPAGGQAPAAAPGR